MGVACFRIAFAPFMLLTICECTSAEFINNGWGFGAGVNAGNFQISQTDYTSSGTHAGGTYTSDSGLQVSYNLNAGPGTMNSHFIGFNMSMGLSVSGYFPYPNTGQINASVSARANADWKYEPPYHDVDYMLQEVELYYLVHVAPGDTVQISLDGTANFLNQHKTPIFTEPGDYPVAISDSVYAAVFDFPNAFVAADMTISIERGPAPSPGSVPADSTDDSTYVLIGQGLADSSVVPEPSAVLLLIAGAICLICRKRQRIG